MFTTGMYPSRPYLMEDAVAAASKVVGEQCQTKEARD